MHLKAVDEKISYHIKITGLLTTVIKKWPTSFL